MPSHDHLENKGQPETSTIEEFQDTPAFSPSGANFDFTRWVKLNPPTLQAKDIERLQHTIGNRAVQRLLATRKRANSSPDKAPFPSRNSTAPGSSIQRRIDGKSLNAVQDASKSATEQTELPVDLTGLLADLIKYKSLDHNSKPSDASEEIMCVERIFIEAQRLGEAAQRFRGSKGIERSDTSWPLLAWELACENLAAQARKEKEELAPLLKSLQESGTTQALEEGSAKYLLVSPSGHNAVGTDSGYGPSIPPEQRYMLNVNKPKDTDPGLPVNIKIKPTELELLVFAGGHGGVEGFFWSDAVGAWWTNMVVEPMVSKGIKAKIIVLDACLSASKVDVFAPLLSDSGKIISYLHSISEMTMSPQVWSGVYQQVQQASPEAITDLLTGQINGKRQLAGGDFKYSSVALYDNTTKNLSYDPQAMGPEALKQVNDDPSFKSEMFQVSKKLKESEKGSKYKLRELQDYEPALTSDKEKGTVVAKGSDFEMNWVANAFMDAGVMDVIGDYSEIKKDGVYFELAQSRYLFIVDKEDASTGTKIKCREATDKEVEAANQ